MRTVDELTQIALAGGGLSLDADQFSVDDLSQIALAASADRAQVNITNTDHLTTDDLKRIALAGRGCVVFDKA